MDVIKIDQDQFAIFLANELLSIDRYDFDMFYDIVKMVKMQAKSRAETKEPVKDTFLLLLRSTGCDMVTVGDPNLKQYIERSGKIYELTFCWNCDYINSIPFCECKQIKQAP